MSRKLLPPIAAVVAGLLVASWAAGQVKIGAVGEFIDPDGDCRVMDDEGKFEITIPGGYHDLDPSLKTINGPRALRDVEGDFLVQVRLANFDVPEKATALKNKPTFRGAGLLVWQDDKNFVTLFRAATNSNRHLFASTTAFKDGVRVFSGTGKDLALPEAWLRLERREGKLLASVSDDGEEWTPMKLNAPDFAKKVRVGIGMVNVTSKDFLAHFEDFSVLQRKADR
jgi:regulation of enolase protein 1 (concanavalin A-like superfamily)